MKTLFEEVTGWMDQQQHKHGLGDGYAEQCVNSMTNWELLQAISEALETMAKEPKS